MTVTLFALQASDQIPPEPVIRVIARRDTVYQIQDRVFHSEVRGNGVKRNCTVASCYQLQSVDEVHC